MAVRANTDYVATDRVDVYNTTVVPTRTRRVSWGAIIAGTVIAMMTMFALYMLGLAIGAATINPTQEIDPVEPALGVGTMIWLAASTLIGFFLGGFTAGRMAGIFNEEDGVLHGLVMWAVVTAITLIMITTSIGNIINGVTSAFATVVSSAGQAVSEVAPEVASAINLQDETLLTIQNEARSLVQPVGESESDESGASSTGTQADTPMTLDDLQFNREIGAFLSLDPSNITDADRDNLAAMVAERTGLTPQEARERVDSWEAAYMEIRQSAEETARQVAQTLADTTTVLAGAIFAAMVVGAFAAGAGGYLGTENLKRDVGIDPERERQVRSVNPNR